MLEFEIQNLKNCQREKGDLEQEAKSIIRPAGNPADDVWAIISLFVCLHSSSSLPDLSRISLEYDRIN